MQRLAPMLLAVSMLTGCGATTKLLCPPVQVQFPAPPADLIQLPAEPALLRAATGGEIEATHQANARLWADQRAQLARLIAWVAKVRGEGRDSILPANRAP